MDNSERFELLMQVIDDWVKEKPDKNTGPFNCLCDEAWIKGISVTPGCSISVAQLKTFLATEVLGIYPWNTNSKVSYRDIQRSLSGEAAKSYSFYYKDLEKCFSPGENKKVVEKNRLFQMPSQMVETMKQEERIPVLLLKRIRDMVWIKLGEYWRMCDPDYAQASVKNGERIKWKQRKGQSPDDEELELPVKKQNKYMECLMVVALHEIFVRECMGMYEELVQEADDKVEKLRLAGDQIADFVARLVSAEDDEKRNMFKSGTYQVQETMDDLKGTVNQVQEMMGYLRWTANYTAHLALCMEHIVSVETEIQLVMILEMKNVGNMKGDANLDSRLARYLECLEDKSVESFTRYNKNKGKYYRKLETTMEDVFFHYVEHIPKPKQKNISASVETYFMLVEKGRMDEGQLQELWEAQCIIAMPIAEKRRRLKAQDSS